MPLRLGVIADDFTGATDIAGFLVAAGLRTVQLNDPEDASAIPAALDVEAVVISLKTRSIPADDAVAQSLSALRILQDLDAERILFKYCSTFDSTAEGNIGPVTDALLEALGEDFTVVVPALPVNGRTVYQGNLFVHHQPLHESGMRDHPVTPMRDSNLMRLMEAQGSGSAINIPAALVSSGVDALRHRLEDVKADGARYAVLDTLTTEHLDVIGEAVAPMRLITGGSGLGSGVARAVTQIRDEPEPAQDWTFTQGPAVILSGSCSEMTNRQVARYRETAPALPVDIAQVLDRGVDYVAEVAGWVESAQHAGPRDPQAPNGTTAPLVYATAAPEEVQARQREHGAEEVSAAVERFFGDLAALLRAQGTHRFITAGGETSGAVTQALEITGFEVGPQIAPGVPWTRGLHDSLDLALKSGNFGDEDFFTTAQLVAHHTTRESR